MAVVHSSRMRRLVRWLLGLRGSPEAIARGAAIGLFISLTPTVGVQAVGALALATLLGANRPVAVVAVGASNPLTFVPAYGFTYWVGSRLWNGPPLSDVMRRLEETVALLGRLDFWAWRDELAALEALGRDVIVPLWIGGIVSGAVLGALGYLATLITIRELRRRRAARTERHKERDDSKRRASARESTVAGAKPAARGDARLS